ncbi:MAG: M48 family metalloprotease, partial [Leptolyngbyaceae bacterium]|nr:M48 family metalloprotease [Leptolyngbyaceae bacterium]
ELPFRFYAVQDPQINAFSTTGGFVYVNTGLLKAVDNSDQLAGVMAHEIAHICNQDLINQLKETQMAQGAASVVGLDQNALVGTAYQLAFNLPNSREAEFQADDQGLKYMKRAGYNPRAMPAFLTKLLKQPSPPEFLSNHPATQDRIQVLKQKIAEG